MAKLLEVGRGREGDLSLNRTLGLVTINLRWHIVIHCCRMLKFRLCGMQELGLRIKLNRPMAHHWCRLRSLEMVPYMPSLQALYVQENLITALHPLHGVPHLQILNLAFNGIHSLSALSALSCCENLRRVDLHGCPLEQHPRQHFPHKHTLSTWAVANLLQLLSEH